MSRPHQSPGWFWIFQETPLLNMGPRKCGPSLQVQVCLNYHCAEYRRRKYTVDPVLRALGRLLLGCKLEAPLPPIGVEWYCPEPERIEWWSLRQAMRGRNLNFDDVQRDDLQKRWWTKFYKFYFNGRYHLYESCRIHFIEWIVSPKVICLVINHILDWHMTVIFAHIKSTQDNWYLKKYK